ncbi:MAG: BON domain-containing protein [Candidatus Dormibacteria bacterium]
MARILHVMRVAGRDQPHDDAAVAMLAQQALAVAFGPAADAMSIRADRGVLTLRGEVEHIDDIAGYEYVARQVPGVRDVDNLLRLRLSGRGLRARVQPA